MCEKEKERKWGEMEEVCKSQKTWCERKDGGVEQKE